MNQLVRTHIDFDGFVAWYNALSLTEQIALMRELNENAGQACFPQAPPYEEAGAVAQLQADEPLIILAKSFASGLSLPLRMTVDTWLFTLSEEDRLTVFRFFVYLFGTAERKVRCDSSSCNHWWHRDLLDARVVEDLLNDPQYYKTSIKDDARVKGK